MKASKELQYVRYCDGFFEKFDKTDGICKECYSNTDFLKCNRCIPSLKEIELDYPLLINWTITEKCQNKCVYCYGDDIIQCNDITLKEDLEEIINHLRYINPKVIVVSGGEPLLHPQIQYILEHLTFCDVIVDTNGLAISQDFFRHIKENMHIRISIDSEKEEINGVLRKNKNSNATRTVINNIMQCVERNIPFSVHTVLSDVNAREITELGDFLIEIGVKLWRILIVTPNDLLIDKENVNKMWIEDAVKRIKEYANENRERIKIRLANNGIYSGRGIILLNSEGKYYVRKINEKEKSIVDINNPKFPKVEQIMNCLEHNAHIERYLYEMI